MVSTTHLASGCCTASLFFVFCTKAGWVIPPLSFFLTCFALELPTLRWRTCGEFLSSTIVNRCKV